MADIDRNSETWLAVSAELHARREQAVDSLIKGSGNDDKRRGHIELIDELLELGIPKPPAPPPVSYD